jgi:hypothetical protein
MMADHSRNLKLAGDASTLITSELEQHLDRAHLIVSIDEDYPSSMLTGKILMTTLRRSPGELTLLANNLSTQYTTEVEEMCQAIDPDRPINVSSKESAGREQSVRLHIGPTARAIRVVPDGYGAHLLSKPSRSVVPRQIPNAVGAAFAAGLAASEAFKYVARVRESRGVLHDYVCFCPFALSSDMSISIPLLSPIELDATLVGVGSIGSAIVMLLDALQLSGRVVLVDRQRYALENVGTYSFGTRQDALRGTWKVELAQQVLTGFDTELVRDPAEDLPALIGSGEVSRTPLVLSALDTAESRRATQRMWPDHLIDAQTGDSMVGFCGYRHGIDPCLMCSFPVDVAAPSGMHQFAEHLGLPPELFGLPGAVLEESHLTSVNAEAREKLKRFIGKPVCSLMDGTVSVFGSDGFQPAATFIALQAACLSVARLAASSLGYVSQSNFGQYDTLVGPQRATVENMKPKRSCVCQTRKTTIEQVRKVFCP